MSEVAAKQDALHKMTLQRLAVRLAAGLKEKHLNRSNQFGLHLFPVSDQFPITCGRRRANLRKDFREAIYNMSGGRMEILYVPAGATGRYQVDDMRLHK